MPHTLTLESILFTRAMVCHPTGIHSQFALELCLAMRIRRAGQGFGNLPHRFILVSIVPQPLSSLTSKKGPFQLLLKLFPSQFYFFCSFHRRENIKKFVRGGTGTYSCMWLYNLLLNAKTPAAIDKLRFDHGAEMQDNALHFLGSIPDTQQFPAARCGMGNDICMYQRTAASSVESMNRANERVRDRTAVDPINSLILLIKLEATRFEKHKENAWNRMDELLTPHSTRLAKDAF